MPIEINETKAALEAAVLDLSDDQIVEAIIKADIDVRQAHKERAGYAWPQEASRNLLAALALRLERGRVRPRSA
jgi:hypothetical protein